MNYRNGSVTKNINPPLSDFSRISNAIPTYLNCMITDAKYSEGLMCRYNTIYNGK